MPKLKMNISYESFQHCDMKWQYFASMKKWVLLTRLDKGKYTNTASAYKQIIETMTKITFRVQTLRRVKITWPLVSHNLTKHSPSCLQLGEDWGHSYASSCLTIPKRECNAIVQT